MNNAYLGSVHSSDLRPKFVWEPSTADSSGDIRYEVQLSTDRTFEGDKIEATVFKPEFQPDNALPVSMVAPVGARYFWRVRACVRDSCSGYTRAWYANVGRVVNDYNCDGYSDLAVGAPGEDSVDTDAGRVRVFFGGREAVIDNEVDGFVGGHRELKQRERTGYAVTSAGDVNGDGCGDIILGVPVRYTDMIGSTYLYLGSPRELFDEIVDTRIFTGQPGDGFGSEVGGVGDLNGDGFDDFYISSPDSSDPYVAVSLYYGEPSSRNDIVPDGSFSFPAFSVNVSGAGDVNGDGFADLIIGNPTDSSAGMLAGIGYLYWGGDWDIFDSEEDVVLKGRGYVDQYGQNVGAAGDVNGDGFSDFLIGNSRAEDNGRGQPGSVDIFLGGRLSGEHANSTMMGTIGNDYFGGSLSAIGDVNGDGYDDVLIGASHSDLNQVDKIDAGRAYLYLGEGGRTFNAEPDALFEGVIGYEDLGERTAGGDFNGDGINDIAISLPGFNRRTGKVEVFVGVKQSLFASTPSAVLTGMSIGDSFGAGLAGN